MKVFVSGSISINELSEDVKIKIKDYISKGYEILIGDAKGVDSLVQEYCSKNNYYNLTVYSIYEKPRFLASEKFKVKHIKIINNIKSERKKQTKKDEVMTQESDFSLIIWDGKSKGSYENILRSLKYKKPIEVYLNDENIYLHDFREEVYHSIYKKNNGYTAKEIIEILKQEGINKFDDTKELYNFLVNNNILKLMNKSYVPEKNFSHMFIVKMYKGKFSELRFRKEILGFIKENVEKEKLKINYSAKQQNLF